MFLVPEKVLEDVTIMKLIIIIITYPRRSSKTPSFSIHCRKVLGKCWESVGRVWGECWESVGRVWKSVEKCESTTVSGLTVFNL
jgi:hypothetical protein